MRQFRGQSILEYSILTIVILAVFLSMNTYIKRGIQGRWKSTVDEFGDQYDPRVANALISYTINSTSNTAVIVTPAQSGQETVRVDTTSSTESKAGQITVGSMSVK